MERMSDERLTAIEKSAWISSHDDVDILTRLDVFEAVAALRAERERVTTLEAELAEANAVCEWLADGLAAQFQGRVCLLPVAYNPRKAADWLQAARNQVQEGKT
jgi:hypothetical protein